MEPLYPPIHQIPYIYNVQQPPPALPRPEVRAAFSALQRERLATPPDVPVVLRDPRRVKVRKDYGDSIMYVGK